ncbi:MAG: hypothetical protein HY901_05375 [Deltaproteobacteria bacterium]|nr:hypothetical protein [Deltaproteobacteria bacterium]
MTLAQGRGSRLMLLKGSLAALGIPSRVVLVRPFTTDPAAYRFAGAELFNYAALQVKTAAEGEVLLAPGIRHAPFGRIAPQAQGQEAMVLPETGEKPLALKTAGSREADGKHVALQLSLSAEGTLSGKGVETYRGLEAAFLRATLERMNQEQRHQALEAAIARTFENGALTELAIEETEEPGSPVVFRFSFVAPGFARADGDGRIIVPHGIYPSSFARRFLHQFERRTPLLIGNPEKLDLEVELELPQGATLAGAPQSFKLETPFGRFERTEQASPGRFSVRQSSSLSMTRVAPEQYRAFGEILIAADQAEQREVVFQAAPSTVAAR